MLFFITPEQAEEFRKVGFSIADGQKFRTGISCGGTLPFNSSRRWCLLVCTDVNGILSSKKLPRLCQHEGETIRIAAKNDRGALGSRPLAGLRNM